jgi:predicted  nucleic acid-binding Zn-ribbon protein
MIEYALLIMLGFCVGGLIAFLLAPTLWHRAVRLTTKRLEATMPMSLSEIEADKDLLRASYAIRIRRLEAGLSKAREKSANQLVEISRLQMQIAELNGRIAALDAQLVERRNAANVFESTIRKRFPELENMVAVAKAALDDRASEIAELHAKLRRREESLDLTQRSALLQQDEIRQLREALETRGADITGRFKRRASQWTLDEYRSEYDRLNVELSKMREQLVLGQERESRQISVLKTELQQLGERIMASATARDRQTADWRDPDRDVKSRQEAPVARPSPTAPRRGVPRPAARAQPWPGGGASLGIAANEERVALPDPVQMRASTDRPLPAPQVKPPEEGRPAIQTASMTPADKPQSDVAVPAPQSAAADIQHAPGQQAGREALKSLLDRGARLVGKELFDDAGAASSAPVAGENKSAANGSAAPSMQETASAVQHESGDNRPLAGQPAKPEPNLDQVFREILEGRPSQQDGAPSGPVTGDDTASATPKQPAATGEETANERSRAEADAKSDASKTQTLLDRLRHIHERQTG